MMVLFIMGILLAIAIPTFLGYTTRAKVAEALTVANVVQRDVTLSWNLSGAMPNTNEQAGASAPEAYSGRFVDAVTVSGGGVSTVSFSDPALAHGTLVFTPEVTDSAFDWTCSSTTLAQSLLPKECRD